MDQKIVQKTLKKKNSGVYTVVASDETIVDFDGDIVLVDGIDTSDYASKNPVVFWRHQHEYPIGQVVSLKKVDGKLYADIRFAKSGISQKADEVKALVDDGIVKGLSIGFEVISQRPPTDDEVKAFPGLKRIIEKSKLYEISVVPVGANQNALFANEVKELIQKEKLDKKHNLEMIDDLFENIETKGAIPYHNYGQAPESTPWDAAAQVREADIPTLKAICAWYDSSNPDVKNSYKLPHHLASNKKAVWRGVAAAMGALLGARGGVNIPAADRKAVYNHLAKHYAEFDRTPPEFKEQIDEADIWMELQELKEILTEIKVKTAENELTAGIYDYILGENDDNKHSRKTPERLDDFFK